MHLNKDIDCRWVFVSTVMNLRVELKAENFLNR
jgi:hypothetical protein